MVWPVLYILATVFITVVPMIAKPFETGQLIFQNEISTIKNIFDMKYFDHEIFRYGLRDHLVRGAGVLPLRLL